MTLRPAPWVSLRALLANTGQNREREKANDGHHSAGRAGIVRLCETRPGKPKNNRATSDFWGANFPAISY